MFASLRGPCTAATLLWLCACSSVTPAGFALATRLDPLTTPPSDLAVAVGVPAALRLADGDAVLRIALFDGPEGARALVEETVPLRIRPNGAGAPAPSGAGETVYLGALSAADAARVAAAQAEIRAIRDAGREGTGAFGIELVGGCFAGPAPEAILVSTWLREAPDAPFVRTSRRTDVAGALGRAGTAALLARIGDCDA